MPRLNLTNIEKVSPTLAAALKAMLKDRPLRAKRFLGCCGMNTEQLVADLSEAIAVAKNKLMDEIGIIGGDRLSLIEVRRNFSSFAVQVLNLLRRIHGVKLDELLLSDATRNSARGYRSEIERRNFETDNCLNVLKMWFHAEVLCANAKQLFTKTEGIKNGLSVAISKEMESLSELITGLQQFVQRDRTYTAWLGQLQILHNQIVGAGLVEIKTTGIQSWFGNKDNGAVVGREYILNLLNPIVPQIGQLLDGGNLPSTVRILQEQREAIKELIATGLAYCNCFSAAYCVGKWIGDGVECIVKNLRDCLVKNGITVWLQCLQYARTECGLRSNLTAETVKQKVQKVINQLNDQYTLLRIANGESRVIQTVVQQDTKALDNVISWVTDFLRANIPVAALAESVARPEDVGVGIVDVEAKHRTADESGAIAKESPAKGDEVTNPSEAGLAHVTFFADSNLTEEQRNRIDEFLQFLTTVQKEGNPFIQEQLDLVRKYLIGLLEKNVTDAGRTVFRIANQLGVEISWINDHGIREKLSELLNPTSDALSP